MENAAIGTTVFEILKNDHRAIVKIMEQLKIAPLDEKEALFSTLGTACTRHTEIEEILLYSSLQDHEGANDVVRDAIADHQGIKDIFLMMDKQDVISGKWQSYREMLEDAMDSHADWEEEVVYPLAMRHLAEEELLRMRLQLETERRKRPSLFTPHATIAAARR